MNRTLLTPSSGAEHCVDITPPFGEHHSATYIRSFAHTTMKDRLPIILTGIIDNMSYKATSIIDTYGPDSSSELEQIVSNLIKLKNELIANKPLKLLELIGDNRDRDALVWNEYIERLGNTLSTPPTWYNTIWYFSESYMYRRIAQIFANTQLLSNYDSFEHQKTECFIGFQNVINPLAKYVVNILNKSENCPSNTSKNDLIDLLKLNLWGNRCDLSLSNGVMIKVTTDNPIDNLKKYEDCILIDNSNMLWDVFAQAKDVNDNIIIDVVLDNAGYELFTDICFAIFLTAQNFAQRIRFYVKAIPWFVSDTTENDFYWTINAMKHSSEAAVQVLGHKCSKYLENGIWSIEVESFWTEPFDYSQMITRSPELYAKLSKASLVIFKGDLNYRKLLGDFNWDYDTNLVKALRGFQPTNLVLLRTIKSDVIAGISKEKVEELFTKQQNWMITGQYGLIHTVIF